MQRIDVPVTALKSELVTLTRGLLEQMRILRVERGSIRYDGQTRSLSVTCWGDEEMRLPLLGYVWAPVTVTHRSCYWLIVLPPSGGLQRIHVPAMTRSHFDPPPGCDDVPQIFVLDDPCLAGSGES